MTLLSASFGLCLAEFEDIEKRAEKTLIPFHKPIFKPSSPKNMSKLVHNFVSVVACEFYKLL